MPRPRVNYNCAICDVKSTQKAHHLTHCDTDKHKLAVENFKLTLQLKSEDEVVTEYRTANINDIIEFKVNGKQIIVKQKPNGEELWNVSMIENKESNDIKYNNARSELMRIIKQCHDKLYKFGISGEKAQNDIMRILTLQLLKNQFNDTSSQLYEKCEGLKDIEDYELFLSICKDIKKIYETNDNGSLFELWTELIENFLTKEVLDQIYFPQDTNFNCRNENGIKDIFTIISKLDIKDEDYASISGDIHEMFLAYGGKKSAKQFGQFFTPRKLIDCMYHSINVIEPTYVNIDANTLVYDPCMGTAGFLTRFYHLVNPNGNVILQSKNFYGCEMEQDTIKQGVMNMYSATGNLSSNIFLCNSLSENHLVFDTKVDNIITNPPFGTKTNYDDLLNDFITYKKNSGDNKNGKVFREKFNNYFKTNEKTKDEVNDLATNFFKSIYPIKVNNGACLFIQHCVYMLKDNGHCIIVLPDGELFEGSSKWSKEFREWWCKSVNITHILSVPGGTFDHAGVKTNVVFFKKSGSTQQIRFMETTKECNIVKDVFTILKADLEASKYSLNIETYKPEKVENYDVPMVKLGDICELQNGKNISKKNRSGTKYPYYGSNGISGHVDEYLYDGEYILLGDQGSQWFYSLRLVNGKFYPSNHTIVIKNKENISINYLYYYLLFNDLKQFNKHSAMIPEILKDKFIEHKIPLPSLEVQEQIVKELDNLQTEIVSQQKHIESLKKQLGMTKEFVNYEEIIELIKDCERVKLGDVVDIIKTGKDLSKVEQKQNIGEIPYIGSGDKEVNKINKYLIDGKYIITGRVGTIGNFEIFNGKYWVNGNAHYFNIKETTNFDYIYYYLKFNNTILNNIIKGTNERKRLNIEDLKNIKIPLHSLEVQEQIVKLYEEREEQVKLCEELISREEKQLEMLKSFGNSIIKKNCITLK